MLTTALATLVLARQDQTVDLQRVFKPGAVYNYRVKSHLNIDHQTYEMAYALPEEIDINYDFSYKVQEVKPSGFASVEYSRPTITEIRGETASSPPQSIKSDIKMKALLTLSPINEITDVKDLTPPATTGGGSNVLRALSPRPLAPQAEDIFGQFAGELYRLSLFVGSLDSALDFNPKLPYENAAVGETWLRTVSYAPQKVTGSDKVVNKRLDMTYTYDGVIESRGKKVHRISAVVKLEESDAAAFIHQMYGIDSTVTQIKAVPLKLETKIIFDLDLNTRHTLYAESSTQGSWKIDTTILDVPYVEETFRGKASIELLSVK